jgi:pimeloyl-ACP methyl ester carboxylesterase
MSDIHACKSVDPGSSGNAKDDPDYIFCGGASGVALLNGGDLVSLLRSPLPGIVIFVHGVNSDGEWYTATERGLCDGLNDRLKRRDAHMKYPTPLGGQLTPANYLPELTPDGFINALLTHKTFIGGDEHFTPAIHFRWGYKASLLELQKYGEGIYLNEQNYWGGGPFANGCTSLPDMWGSGMSDELLLWLHVQHLNPVPGRPVYSCPPRPYFVLAALRLAKLIASIREKQADVPITLVCHSQGNMIGMAAAFMGDAMTPVTDRAGKTGRCVADTYVLANPPYSVADKNDTEDWSCGDEKDKRGNTGRQTRAARIGTLRAFFDIVRQPAAKAQDATRIDPFVANKAHGFDTEGDRGDYGYGEKQSTCGRVTLYCNPHDEVISSLSVQGIGWRGMSDQEITDAGGDGLFTQRVFAQGYPVGKQGNYHYWDSHYKRPERGSVDYWVPPSLKVRYSVSQGLEASTGFVGWVFTLMAAPAMIVTTSVSGMRINALPDKNWTISIKAPDLPAAFAPEAWRFGAPDKHFDQTWEAPGQARDRNRSRSADDPYAGDRTIPGGAAESDADHPATDAALGDSDSEATLRYEDHARLRMQARREGLVSKDAQQVDAEDNPDKAGPSYTAWRNRKIKTFLAESIDAHATDHSTIMTNPMHAEKALAYDVAVGMCHIADEDLHQFRIAADWRFANGLDDSNACKLFKEYFTRGLFSGLSPLEWTKSAHSQGHMPYKIVDQRAHAHHVGFQERLESGDY